MLASLLLNEPVAVDPAEAARKQRDYEREFEARYDAIQQRLRGEKAEAKRETAPGAIAPGPDAVPLRGDEDEDEAIALILSLIRK